LRRSSLFFLLANQAPGSTAHAFTTADHTLTIDIACQQQRYRAAQARASQARHQLFAAAVDSLVGVKKFS